MLSLSMVLMLLRIMDSKPKEQAAYFRDLILCFQVLGCFLFVCLFILVVFLLIYLESYVRVCIMDKFSASENFYLMKCIMIQRYCIYFRLMILSTGFWSPK